MNRISLSSAPVSAAGRALRLPLRPLALLGLLPVVACGGVATEGPVAPPTTDRLPLERTLEAGGHRLVIAPQETPVTALLQAVSPVDADVVWVSGHEGRWLRTEDGGGTWFAGRGPAGDSLQFRDVEGFGPATAYLMSAGAGAASRIYRTDDGGSSWGLQYRAEHPDAFLDCMAFWDRETGVAYGDAVDGTVFILRTEDGGARWERVPAAGAPAALEGEGGFAASGTCAVAGENGRGWIATGNGTRARVLVTDDRGRSWTAVDAPVVAGPASGLTTVAVRGEAGVAAGGVIGADTIRSRSVAASSDGGLTWREGGAPAMPGPVYGSAIVPGLDDPLVVAVGPGGMDWSVDGGRSWLHADDRTWWAVAFASPEAGWAVGPGGRVVRLSVETTARR